MADPTQRSNKKLTFPGSNIFDPFPSLNFCSFSLALTFLATLLFINKQFSIDSFLDWEDHHFSSTQPDYSNTLGI